jgi:hypothetical protein
MVLLIINYYYYSNSYVSYFILDQVILSVFLILTPKNLQLIINVYKNLCSLILISLLLDYYCYHLFIEYLKNAQNLTPENTLYEILFPSVLIPSEWHNIPPTLSYVPQQYTPTTNSTPATLNVHPSSHLFSFL